MILLPLFLLLYSANCTFSSVFPLLKRLRWLFLSLFILNLCFNSAGLLLAVMRVVILILIVLAAHLLIRTTPTQDIIAALQWWLIPLNKIGLTTERLAVRLALVLDTVTVVQTFYKKIRTTVTKNPITKISETVAELLRQVLNHAETTPLRTLEIQKFQSPPVWQWSYPLFLLVLIFIF